MVYISESFSMHFRSYWWDTNGLILCGHIQHKIHQLVILMDRLVSLSLYIYIKYICTSENGKTYMENILLCEYLATVLSMHFLLKKTSRYHRNTYNFSSLWSREKKNLGGLCYVQQEFCKHQQNRWSINPWQVVWESHISPAMNESSTAITRGSSKLFLSPVPAPTYIFLFLALKPQVWRVLSVCCAHVKITSHPQEKNF